jgi:trigger factor
MKTTVESPDPLHKTIQVEIPWDMIAEELDRSLKELAGQVKLKGFRPGKVPKSVIRQRYGKKAQDDVLGRLIADSYEAALIQQRIRAVSKPEFERGALKEGEPYSYTARVEVAPEIEIKQIHFELEKPVAEVTPEMLDEQLQNLRDKKAVLVPIDDRRIARKGDTAVIDYSTTQDGKPVEGGSMTNHPVQLGSGKSLPGFDDEIVGMETDSTKEFDLTFPEGWGPSMLSGKEVRFEVRLQALKRRELPELNDEFAKDLGRPDCDSLDKLREQIRSELLEGEQAKVDRETKDKLIDKLCDANPFPVPPTLINRQQDVLAQEMELYLSKQGINLEKTGLNRDRMKKDLRERAEKEIKTALLLTAIAEQEKISVTEDEIESQLQQLADKSGTNIARIKAIYDQQGARDRLRNQLMQDKVLDILLAASNMDEKAADQADGETGTDAADTEVNGSQEKK